MLYPKNETDSSYDVGLSGMLFDYDESLEIELLQNLKAASLEAAGETEVRTKKKRKVSVKGADQKSARN